MIIDSSYFTGPIKIAQKGELAVLETLEDYIVQYETEYLCKVLGYELSLSFLEGIDVGSDETIEAKWSDILDGRSFVKYDRGYTYHGIGKDIARYVYWHYIKDLHTQQVGSGTVKTKNAGATQVSPIFKMMNAWNEMAKSTMVLLDFLQVNSDVYGWQRSYCDETLITTQQNQFGV